MNAQKLLSVTLCLHCPFCSFVQNIKTGSGTPSHSLKVAPHLHIVLRLRMIGAMLPLHHTLCLLIIKVRMMVCYV
jgi:hypothetical protein